MGTDMEQHPRLRTDLDFIPIQGEGRKIFLVRDSLGLVAEGSAIPGERARILALLDGRHSLQDLQEHLAQLYGAPVSREDVDALVAALDAAGLLDSPRYRQTRDALAARFAASPVRDCALAGVSYPAEAEDLTGLLNALLPPASAERPGGASLRALIAPHIDPAAGAAAYAAAYGTLRGHRPQRIIVLGIGHQMERDLFSLTAKDFRTPLGTVPCDAAAMALLQKAAGGAAAPDDFAHRSEHSIELQMLFLQHVLDADSFRLVPVLCGPLPANSAGFDRNAYLDRAGPLLQALKGLLADTSCPTLAIAAVDFCHIGPKFGHAAPADELESDALAHGRRLLEALLRQNAPAFWEEASQKPKERHVCGLPALAALLEILPPCRGEGLDHRVWREPPTRSAVTLAAAAYYDARQSGRNR